MKKIFYPLFLCFIFNSVVQSQTSVSIRLSSATGEGAYVSDFYPTTHFAGSSDLVGVAWTSSGTPYVGRSYFKYDLSAVPANAVVISAHLSLYANPNPVQPAHSTLSGSNAAYIQQVTGNWDENLITWNNSPSSTNVGQAVLPMSTSMNSNYIQIDVTQMVNQMVSNPSTNYGFMLRLQNETFYRSLNLASLACTDTSKQPLLEITYSTNQSCVTYKLDTLTGAGAYVSDFYPNTNFVNSTDLVGIAWTEQGTPYIGRSYFKYDLSSIPSNAVVSNAYLSLYANPSPVQPAHSTLSGSNSSLIQKVTDPWNENIITWTNKPNTTAVDEVQLSPSVTPNTNYLNIDVTTPIAQMVNNPSTNNGFMLRLQTESQYRSLNFASISCADSTKKPKLVICYSLSASIQEMTVRKPVLSVFPNPSSGAISVSFDHEVTYCSIELLNLIGEVVFSEKFTGSKMLINVTLPQGIYILKCSDALNVWSKKIILR
jgi:hypothetical protein